MKLHSKALVGLGLFGMAAAASRIFVSITSKPGHVSLNRVENLLSIYHELAPNTHTKLTHTMKQLEACIAATPTKLSTIRQAEDAARQIRRYLAEMDVSVRSQSRNNTESIQEFSEIANQLLDICEIELGNLHVAYHP